ncbi:Nucleotide exchange factor GrpE [Planctomycetales bacterium 10988]|nr:Nucleotide exchange factor GrpE [Planctomycetales bacterium 10988]
MTFSASPEEPSEEPVVPNEEETASAEASPEQEPPTEPEGEELAPPEIILPEDYSLRNREEELQEKIHSLESKLLRTQAELENTRRRAQREIQDVRQYAAIPMLRDLLTILDHMQLALQAADKTEDVESLKKGFSMVIQQFESALNQHGCKKIDALHQPFDPNLHEALLRQPSEDHPEMTVLQELRSGYQMNDRVIRPSQVSVSSGAPAPAPSDSEE